MATRPRSASSTPAWTSPAITDAGPGGAPKPPPRPTRGAPRQPGQGLAIGWRVAVFIAALLPVAAWFGRGLAGFDGGFGANPTEFLTRSSGFWTLTFLCLTLTVTPLRRLTGWQAVIRLRRMLGLYTFFYATVHLITWVWFDQWFDPRAMLDDIVKRPFIAVGFSAWLLLVPLALTSNAASIRRLGRHWRSLHRLVYPIAMLGLLHFWWHKAGKNDFAVPIVFAAVVAVLFAIRLVSAWQRRRAAPRRRPVPH